MITSDGMLRQHSEEGAAAITWVFLKRKSSLTAITRMGESRSSFSTLRSEKELLMQDSESQLLQHQATT